MVSHLFDAAGCIWFDFSFMTFWILLWAIHFLLQRFGFGWLFFFCWVISPLSTVTVAAFGRGLLTRIRCCTGMQRLMQGRSDHFLSVQKTTGEMWCRRPGFWCVSSKLRNIFMIKMSCACSNEFGKRKKTFHCSPCSLHVWIAAMLLGNICYILYTVTCFHPKSGGWN